MVVLERTQVQVGKLAELARILAVEIDKPLELEPDIPVQLMHRLVALEEQHTQRQVVADTLAVEVADMLELDSGKLVLAIGIAVVVVAVAFVAADIAVVVVVAVVAVVEVVDYSLVVAIGIAVEVPGQVVKTHKELQQRLELDSLEKQQRQQLEDGYEPHGWCRPNCQLEVHFLRTQ